MDSAGTPTAAVAPRESSAGPVTAGEERRPPSRGSGAGQSGGGFYPPMMPPMYPPGGGGGRGGVQPGEADFATGAMRRARTADTWRAGLQPHLLGRGGDRDEEPDLGPPLGDDVLDEELWQVPGGPREKE